MPCMSDARIKQQRAILKEALPIAAFDGWSQATLTKAAVKVGMPAMEARRLFPDGVPEALICYAEWLREQLMDAVKQTSLKDMRVHERIRWLVLAYFALMEPHREAVRRAAAIGIMPQHATRSIRTLWQLCDVMWRLAGDSSTDFNYYTKRGLLAKVIASSFICWLNDTSVEHTDTQAFLDRRLQDVLRTGKAIGQTRQRIVATVESATDQLLNRKRYRAKRRS